MNRANGNKGIALKECVNPVKNKWRVRWGVTPTDETDENVDFWEEEFGHEPSKDEIQAFINNAIDTEAQEKILSGLKYNGLLVWLSAENQRNYTATAIRIQTGDTTALPVKVKLGTDEAPTLQEFATAGDFLAFFNTVNKHISDVVAEAWKAKLNIDWDAYNLKE